MQLSTDGHRPYIDAVAEAFGDEVDYAMIAKSAIVPENGESDFCAYTLIGSPDPDHINTSYIERYNLTVRMTDRRFTRKTNAFSKCIDNHISSVALHVLFYNFCRAHMALDGKTPAMAAKIAKRAWYYEDIVELADSYEASQVKASGLVRIRR